MEARSRLLRRRTPAVLDGVDLTVVSVDRVTIRRPDLEGVRCRMVPLQQGFRAQLVICAAARDAVTGERTEGGTPSREAPDRRSSRLADRGLRRILNRRRSRSVELLGALDVVARIGNGSRYLDPRSPARSASSAPRPPTAEA